MTLVRHKLTRTIAAAALAFAAALAVFMLMNHSSHPARSSADSSASPASLVGASTDTRIRSFQALVRAHPRDSRGYSFLGDAYLQKVRETGDASFYTRADGVYGRALELNPRDAAATTGMGTLALARHDFRAGLRYGLRAHALAPAVVKPLGVIVDAYVELGRYHQAADALQRMIDLKPNLASYARVSYFREL
ncbi:MAG TPA: hypothetical protein VF752_00200, partial [Thermoleophilaceae bacterium]